MSLKAWALAALVVATAHASGPSRAADAKGAPSQGDASTSAAVHPELLDTPLQWIWFGSGKEQFDVDAPERYTIEFFADGTLAIQADCNRGTGNYAFKPDGGVDITPLAITMMLCEEPSLGDRFVKTLDQVRLYFEKEGDFFLEAPLDSGTLRFRRQPAE